jgi:predicted Mrr-cat superfamily restriction endonuclease
MSKYEVVTNVWLVRCGEGGSAVDACITNDVVAVRFAAVGDASLIDEHEIAEQIRTFADPSDQQRLTTELLAFANEVKVGDTILTPDKSRGKYFLARVTGDYRWDEDSPVPDMHHLHSVEWINFLEWDTVPMEFKSIKYYQRSIVQIHDPTLEVSSDETMQVRLAKSDLLKKGSAKKSSSARPRKAAAKVVKPTPSPTEKRCAECGLKKHLAQFDGASDRCVDCE